MSSCHGPNHKHFCGQLLIGNLHFLMIVAIITTTGCRKLLSKHIRYRRRYVKGGGNMYMYMYTCICIYIYININICIYIYICIYVYIYTYIFM